MIDLSEGTLDGVPFGYAGHTVCATVHEHTGGDSVSFLAWIVLGLISGFIASKIVNKSGKGVLMDIVLGIVGAVVGGWLFNTFGHMGVTGVDLYSTLVAIVGSVIVLFIYHTVSRISAPHIGSW